MVWGAGPSSVALEASLRAGAWGAGRPTGAWGAALQAWGEVLLASGIGLQMVAFVATLPPVTASERFQVGHWSCPETDDGWYPFSLVPLWETVQRGHVNRGGGPLAEAQPPERALPFTSCVTLCQLHNLSVPQYSDETLPPSVGIKIVQVSTGKGFGAKHYTRGILSLDSFRLRCLFSLTSGALTCGTVCSVRKRPRLSA